MVSEVNLIIYLVENLINHKVYIGQSVESLGIRRGNHIRTARQYAKGKLTYHSRFYAALNKYGADKFVFHVLDEAKNIDELNEKEIAWIRVFNSRNSNFGYNIQGGGFAKGRMAEETKKKISLANQGKHSGPKSGMYGKIPPNKTFTPEIELEIYKKYATTCSQRALAKEYNVHQTTITNIVKRIEKTHNYSAVSKSRAKLSNEQQLNIFAEYGANVSKQDLAKAHNVSKRTINRILQDISHKKLGTNFIE